jgi:hypothetical protein
MGDTRYVRASVLIVVAACSSGPDPESELADLKARTTIECRTESGAALDELANAPDVYCINMNVKAVGVTHLHASALPAHEDWFTVDGHVVDLQYREDEIWSYWSKQDCASLAVQTNEDSSGAAVYQVIGVACTPDYQFETRR